MTSARVQNIQPAGRFPQRMAVALRQRNNAADGRFGRVLRGFQACTPSALPGLERQSVFLQPDALLAQMPESQKVSALIQRFLNRKKRIHSKTRINCKTCLLAIFLFCAACADREPSLQGLDGTNTRLSQLEGKLVLINYWAEWCKPCRQEIPELNAFAANNPDRVALYGVNFDGIVGEELKQQASNMGIGFPVLAADPRGYFDIAPSGVLPETLVIDQRGEVQQVLLGPQSEEKLEILLASFTEEVHYNNQ